MTLLEVERVSKWFGGVRAVGDVSFALEEGELLGVMGPNGSGKTTLFNLIAGALAPDTGAIRLRGRDIAGHAPHRVCARGIARTFQLVRPFRDLTVRENVLVGGLYGRARRGHGEAFAESERLLRLIGLEARADTPAAQSHPHRQEASRARPRARDAPGDPAARRVPGRPQPHRDGARDDAHP